MRLTTARYYTPSGDSIQAKGIHPDIEVKPSRIEEIESRPGRREENLRGALDNGEHEKDAKEAAPQAKPDAKPEAGKTAEKEGDKKAEPVDYQLLRAVDLLRGVALFSGALTSSTN
mgnify:FL=1